jgi:hypothetical protein
VASTNFPVRPWHFALAANGDLKNGRYKTPGKGLCELSTWFLVPLAWPSKILDILLMWSLAGR